MDKELVISGKYKGKLTLEYLPCINYAMVLNTDMAFQKFILRNDDSFDWEEIKIVVSGDLFEVCQLVVEQLRANTEVSFDSATLMPVATKLMTLTETVQTSFSVNVTVAGQSVFCQSLPIKMMAFDQWTGSAIMPELLASFVTPNHPVISPLCLRASKYLNSFSGRRDLDSYFSLDGNRVVAQIESVYNALLDEDITYIIAPPSFEESGQRIRLVDKVLKDKLGNCLELSLLLCSCLESIGIRTILFLSDSHAFMGAWIDPTVQVPMVGTDFEVISDAINDKQLMVIESTALTRGEHLADAISQGETFISQNLSQLECFIDVCQARINRIRPLPHCIEKDGTWEIQETPDYDTLFDELALKNPYEIHGVANDKLKSKQMLWERKLLDLSLRNNLLNMKSGRHIVPLKERSIKEILQHLQSETLVDDIKEDENFSTAKELYRAARVSLEENGANTLFLSIGTLRWYEVGGYRPYFAPVIFLPIEMVRHGARKYVIRLRDEEPMVNITLLEMLRQTFELEVPPLSPVPEDEKEMVDWARVFRILRTCIAEINEKQQSENHWEIVEECMIGIFSFTKFVMWNDIHSHPQVLQNHPFINSMIEGKLTSEEQLGNTDARQLDYTSRPADYAIPVDVDSSQLEAIVNSAEGKSFILYGPPGTGKSQTITNIIANALYKNKRVLFVAEKKAALEVVQDRLGKIGLEPYCLELHSNKVDKKSFLAQMEMALNVPVEESQTDFDQKSEEIYQKRQELNGYIEAMHRVRENGLSLYEYINRYLEIDAEALPLQYRDVCNLKLDNVNDISDSYILLDKIAQVIGMHPSQHPLQGLYPLQNTAQNQNAVTLSLASMPQHIMQSRKKERGWINRWFLKRTALNILHRSAEWKNLLSVAGIHDSLKNDLDAFDTAVGRWNENIEMLRQWYHYSTHVLQNKLNLNSSEHRYFLEGNTGKQTADAFRKGYFLAMAMHIVNNDPALRSFNGMLFEDIIESYRKLTRQFQEYTKKELCGRLSRRVPRAGNASKQIVEEINVLKKRIANHGRSMSVRRMLDQSRHLLPRLCPCMLMSPLSVAQYLDMQSNQFDLVIFDEASQMPTSEAVGAIARGKAVIVVGDPKQMPPTSFFMAQSTNDNDVDIDDLDSILDDCISLSLPSRYLSWHYRSKHESLIAFSNTHFYDGKLITFPSVDDQERKLTLQHVDGFYDFGKSRSNKAEAKAIVDEVIMRLQAQLLGEPFRSIGIVAFSKVQSNLIDDMLADALAKRPDLEKLAMSHDEPIFVKNLENVQGDERDIILFSVGYGPDKKGKVSMNFGPLNQTGGERRLNVAVSRARYEMKVFSTLQSHQIDLQRTNAAGVAGLKRFLEFAETGQLPRPSSQNAKMVIAPLTQQIADSLRKEGYEVHTNVGRSGFKIDIAVVDKDNPSRYAFGVRTDSLPYYHTPTARDREIVQPSILTTLGWNLKHVWTADWLENKKL
ncbi:MAG: DUF4011 domain-containing protein [Bacteroidaceae bacterium]|nr:DUF4011 domain-containing protein [Bacteroidaceae bacterium]